MSQGIRYVGFDVSKDTIAVAVAEPDGSVVEFGSIANDPGAVRSLVERLSRTTWSGRVTTPEPTACAPSITSANSCSVKG